MQSPLEHWIPRADTCLMRKPWAIGLAMALGAIACGCGLGTEMWRFETRRPFVISQLQAYTPAIHDGTIYFCGGNGAARSAELTALRPDGSVRWHVPLGSCGHPPIVVDSTVVAWARPKSMDDRILGLDPANGRERWRADFHLVRHSAVVGPHLYVSLDDGKLCRVDTATGEVVTIAVERTGRRPVWLVADGDRLLFGSGTAVWSIPTADAEPRVEPPLRKLARQVSSAILAGDLLLLQSRGDHTLTAYSREDGRVVWERRWRVSTSQPMTAHGLVLINVFGPMELEALDLASGARRWSVRDGSRHPPVVVGDVVYAGGRTTIMTIDLATGVVKARFPGNAEVISSPVPWEDLLLFGTVDGVLHAFRRPVG